MQFYLKIIEDPLLPLPGEKTLAGKVVLHQVQRIAVGEKGIAPDQRGSPALTCSRNSLKRDSINGYYVVAIDRNAGTAANLRSQTFPLGFCVGWLSREIMLRHQNHWQMVATGEFEGLTP